MGAAWMVGEFHNLPTLPKALPKFFSMIFLASEATCLDGFPFPSLSLRLVPRACHSLQRWKASCAASLVRACLLRAYESPRLGRANVGGHRGCSCPSFRMCFVSPNSNAQSLVEFAGLLGARSRSNAGLWAFFQKRGPVHLKVSLASEALRALWRLKLVLSKTTGFV